MSQAAREATMIDWFAACAMQGLLCDGQYEGQSLREVAADAYDMAEAMEAERERRTNAKSSE